jgi:hypothetical protein
MEAVKFTIPNFVSAASPQGLRRVMFQKCIKDGLLYTFFDIQFVNGKWIAWFKEEPNDIKEVAFSKE